MPKPSSRAPKTIANSPGRIRSPNPLTCPCIPFSSARFKQTMFSDEPSTAMNHFVARRELQQANRSTCNVLKDTKQALRKRGVQLVSLSTVSPASEQHNGCFPPPTPNISRPLWPRNHSNVAILTRSRPFCTALLPLPPTTCLKLQVCGFGFKANGDREFPSRCTPVD